MLGIELKGTTKAAAHDQHTEPMSLTTPPRQAPDGETAEMPRADFEPLLVRIPTGPFLMGSNEAYKSEQPSHTVELSEYWIGKYPVTNVEYQAFVRDAEHRAPARWDGDAYPEDMGDHPVAYVSWNNALAYCAWLSEKTAKAYRLPTEAQWEKAARSDDARVYPWGNEWDESRLNCREGGPGGTTPVGHYSPDGDSPYGATDMVGNVWEWCADWLDADEYKRRADGKVRDPEGPQQGERRVLRGGYGYILDFVRCTARHGAYPRYRGMSVGFRVVLCP